MNLEYAKELAREQIKQLARTREEENAMLSGMLILEDALNGEL